MSIVDKINEPTYALVNKNATEILPEPVYPQDLKYLRPTQVAVLVKCPKKWAAETLLCLGKEEPLEFSSIDVPLKPTAGQIGTAAHQILEDFERIAWKLDGYELIPESYQTSQHPAYQWIPADERANIQRTIANQIQHDDEELLELEFEFTEPWSDDPLCPPVKGHIDRITRKIGTNVLVINDYKTNRGAETIDEWRTKPQQRLYAWAMRKRFPAFKIMWRIIYVNLGFNLEWETSPQDDVEQLEELMVLWTEALSTQQETPADISQFREHLHDNCNWCPVKQSCKTYRLHTQATEDSLALILPDNPIERYEKLKVMEKLLKQELADTKEKAIAQIKAKSTEDKPLQYNKLYWTLEYGSRRGISFWQAWPILVELFTDYPELYTELVTEDAITLKMGAVDKILRHGVVREKLTPLIYSTTSEEPTIKSRKTLK